MYKIVLDKKVLKDLKKIHPNDKKKILETIETDIAINPYSGKKLLGDLSTYYRYRVGNYRIVYSIFDDIIEVEIIKVAHRKKVYK